VLAALLAMHAPAQEEIPGTGTDSGTDTGAEEETEESLPPPSSAAVKADLHILTPGKNVFVQPLFHGSFRLHEPHYFKRRVTLAVPSGTGAAQEAVLDMTVRMSLAPEGTALAAQVRSLTRIVQTPEAWKELAGEERRALRRAELTMAGADAQILETFRLRRPEGAYSMVLVLSQAPLREHEEAARRLAGARSAHLPPVRWRIQILLMRHTGGETLAMEAMELWARPDEPAVYLYDQSSPDAAPLERFELRLTPHAEAGACVLTCEASGKLLTREGRPVILDRRDVTVLRDGEDTLSLSWGEKDSEGRVTEGVSADIQMEAVESAP
jgi:hypothetical protein